MVIVPAYDGGNLCTRTLHTASAFIKRIVIRMPHESYQANLRVNTRRQSSRQGGFRTLGGYVLRRYPGP